jgi:hypothetical protein
MGMKKNGIWTKRLSLDIYEEKKISYSNKI